MKWNHWKPEQWIQSIIRHQPKKMLIGGARPPIQIPLALVSRPPLNVRHQSRFSPHFVHLLGTYFHKVKTIFLLFIPFPTLWSTPFFPKKKCFTWYFSINEKSTFLSLFIALSIFIPSFSVFLSFFIQPFRQFKWENSLKRSWTFWTCLQVWWNLFPLITP